MNPDDIFGAISGAKAPAVVADTAPNSTGDPEASRILALNPGMAAIAKSMHPLNPAPDTTAKPDADPFGAISGMGQPHDPMSAISGAKPGLWERAKALGRSMLPQEGEGALHAIGRDITGFVSAPIKSAFDAVATPTIGEPRRANLRAPTPSMGLQTGTYDAEHGAITPEQQRNAGIATAVNAAALGLPIGEIANPALRVAAQGVTGAGIGVANSPDDRGLGALVGGALGGLHAAAGELPLGAVTKKIGTKLNPEMAAEAARVPGLAAERDIANARVQARDRNFEDFSNRLLAQKGVAPNGVGTQITPHEVGTDAAGTHPLGVEEPATPHPEATAPALQSGGVDAPTTAQAPFASASGLDRSAQPALADQIEQRGAGLPPFVHDGVDVMKHAFDRPYPQLEHGPANDMAVRDALLSAGGARGTAGTVIGAMRQHIEDGIAPEDLNAIRPLIMAHNFEKAAEARSAAGDYEAAQNLMAHATNAYKLVPSGTATSAPYQQYVSRFNAALSDELERVAKGGGTSDKAMRGTFPNSVYVPLAKETEAALGAQAPTETVQPNRLKTLGNRYSSAAKVATGSAHSYMMDPLDAVGKVYAERAHVAAENDLWSAIKARGREVAKGEDVQPGEQKVAFNDQWQHVNSESTDATHYVAVPDHVNDALGQYVQRQGNDGPRGPLPKALAYANKKLIEGTMAINPAVTVFHGSNIANQVNRTAGTGPLEAARIVASALPQGNVAAGLAQMAAVDMTSAETARDILTLARYGGVRPTRLPETGEAPTTLGGKVLAAGKKVADAQHSLLFGQSGADIRGRVASYRLFKSANPDASAADAAQFVAQRFGQYNPANQPAGVYMLQKYGYTSFAPAGVAFTSSAVKGLAGQGGGVGALNMAKTALKAGLAVEAGKQAINYYNTGHSTLGNEPGHRADANVSKWLPADSVGNAPYIKNSYGDGLTSRAENTLGLRPLAEGEGAAGFFSGPTNEVLSQASIPIRMGMGLANSALRNDKDDNPQALVKPQFGEGNRFMKVLGRSTIGMATGSIGGLSGASQYEAGKSLQERALDAVHMNPIAHGSPYTSDPASRDYKDKMSEAKQEILTGATYQDRMKKVDEIMKRLDADGQMNAVQKAIVRAGLLRDAGQGTAGAAGGRTKALAREGFLPRTPTSPTP